MLYHCLSCLCHSLKILHLVINDWLPKQFFVDNILAIHPRNKYFGGRKAYGIPLLQIYIQSISHPSPGTKRISRYWLLKNTECSETRRQFSSYFLRIIQYFIFIVVMTISMERKHGVERRQKNNNNKERHSCDHHLKEKYTPSSSSRLAEVVPCHKNTYRAHWFS